MPSLDQLRVVNPLVPDLLLGYTGPSYLIATKVMLVKVIPKLASVVPFIGKETKRHHSTVVVDKELKRVWDYQIGSRTVTVQLRAGHALVSQHERREAEGSGIDPDELGMQHALDDVYRDLEVVTSQMVFNLASWTNSQAAAAAWANIAYDLPAQVDTQASVVEAAIGIDRAMLSLVIGQQVWPWVRRNTLVRQQAAIALGIRDLQSAPIGYVTQQIVAQALGLKEIIVGREFVATDVTPPTFAPCWADDAALMYLPEDVNNPIVPPFGYNIRREGYPLPAEVHTDYTREGNPDMYDVNDAISPNVFGDPGLTTSECGYYWDNAV